MTTPDTTFARTPQVQEHFVFPDPPEDPEDKMTSFDHLTITGTAHSLAVHLGNRETTLVAGDRYLALAPTRNLSGVRYPDLLVAFGVDPEAYHRSNAYVISEQGKPPDLVLEVASRSSGRVDVTEKRVDYARLGILEYWRFAVILLLWRCLGNVAERATLLMELGAVKAGRASSSGVLKPCAPPRGAC